jgi:hypothetical protein
MKIDKIVEAFSQDSGFHLLKRQTDSSVSRCCYGRKREVSVGEAE